MGYAVISSFAVWYMASADIWRSVYRDVCVWTAGLALATEGLDEPHGGRIFYLMEAELPDVGT